MPTDYQRRTTDRTSRNSPGKAEICCVGGLLEASMPVFGLLHLLQTLKRSRLRCVGTFAVKLAAIPQKHFV